jgi:hypothetical protein
VTPQLRKTDWIMTASGIPFWPLEPLVEDVRIADIAHHLAHLCRFTGAVRQFYSVAQHSVLVSKALEHHVARSNSDAAARSAPLYGLLHDGSEAYLMDVPRPLKRDGSFGTYRVAEKRLQAVIYRAFALDIELEPADLKLIDRRMLRTEQRDLMPPPALDERRDDVEPFAFSVLDAWTPARARLAFLKRFADLTGAAAPSLLDVVPGLKRGTELGAR